MLYELCALAPPFTATNQSELNHKIRGGEFSRLPSHYSQDLEVIIRRMISVEVSCAAKLIILEKAYLE